MNWLVKEEPTHYSFDDLIRDGRTAWTGVRNPLAQKHLQSVHEGDRIFFYHTGNVKAVVGIAKAACEPYPAVDKRITRKRVLGRFDKSLFPDIAAAVRTFRRRFQDVIRHARI